MRLPRQIKNSLLMLPLFFAAQKVCAQLVAPADDFFNGGAQLYISNNIPDALKKTEDGLQIYPNDEKLQKLEKLLKQQQQQQQNQQNQSQQQQSQSQQNQQQQSQQNSQDQKKSDEQKQNQADQKNEDQQRQSEQQKSNGEGQPVPGQMTQEEAKKLLDAQKGDEQVLQLKPQGKPQNQNRTVKDW